MLNYNALYIECLYCGNTWKDLDYTRLKCPNCQESKLLKKYELGDTDVFGYRYSPEFPKKSSAYDELYKKYYAQYDHLVD